MTAAAPWEFRVRQGEDGRWCVDRHAGIFAETVAQYDTREEADRAAFLRQWVEAACPHGIPCSCGGDA